MRIILTMFPLVALVLSGCSNTPATSESVPWKDYAPVIKTRIDNAATNKDCRTLQTEFNTADAGNAATRLRTGHSNTALMGYIDNALRNTGCYK